MKFVFITVESPFGTKEGFLNTELMSLAQQNPDIVIYPLKPSRVVNELGLVIFVPKITPLSACISIFRRLFIHFIPLIKILFFLARKQKIKRFIYSLYFLPKTMLILDFVKTNKIMHIHAYWGGAPATCAFIINKLINVPWSFSVHRSDIELNDIIAEKSRSTQFIRSISKWGKNKLLELKADPKKIHVIHLGVKVPNFVNKKINNLNTKNIVTVASLTKLKNIDRLVAAVSKIPDTTLTVIGKGPEKKKIARIINTLGSNNRIFLSGYLPNKEIIKLYRNNKFDLFVLASSIEGIPVSAMEAMAYGIPVALTKVGGTSELINKNCGFFLQPNLENLDHIINNIPNKKMSLNAQKRVLNEFNTTKNSQKFLKLLKTNEI